MNLILFLVKGAFLGQQKQQQQGLILKLISSPSPMFCSMAVSPPYQDMVKVTK